MRNTLLLVSTIFIALFVSCGGNQQKEPEYPRMKTEAEKAQDRAAKEKAEKKADPKGIGEVQNVELTNPLEESMVKSGKAIYEMKCSACHKLTDQRVVGPGWAGVTNIRRPEWIMNMITNVDVMLEEDPTARKLLEECLTRMPNQGLSVGDARDVLEFMRKNDMENVGEKDKGADIS